MSWLKAAKNLSDTLAIAAVEAAQESAIELRNTKINALDRLEEFTGRAPTEAERQRMLYAEDFCVEYQNYIAQEEERKRKEITLINQLKEATAVAKAERIDNRNEQNVLNTKPATNIPWFSTIRTPIKAQAVVSPAPTESIVVLNIRGNVCHTPKLNSTEGNNASEISANSSDSEAAKNTLVDIKESSSDKAKLEDSEEGGTKDTFFDNNCNYNDNLQCF